MKVGLTGAILLLSMVSTFAQDRIITDTLLRAKKMSYFFNIQSGTLIGCNDCGRGKELSFSGATVHGVKIGKRLRVGVGLGFDAYSTWNIVPVFGSASWDLFSRKNAFFIQLNYGGTLKSWKYSPYIEYGYRKSEGGTMINPMVGYRIRYHDLSIALMTGYKFQKVSSFYEYPSYYWDSMGGQLAGDPSTSRLRQEMNRFTIAMSIGWR